jgi:hypothetical protein
MEIEKRIRLLLITLAALAMLALPRPAFSQNCALCYSQAASAGARMIQALRSGILVLIIPPMFMWVGLTIIVYRKRNQFKQADYPPESDHSW